MNSVSPIFSILDFIGGSEILLILFIALILFGGEKMPELARGLGKALREIKKATSGVEEEFKKALSAPANPPPKKPSTVSPAAATAPPKPEEPYVDPYKPEPPSGKT